jgi:two-component system cell cycle response regulator DivK
MEQKTILLIEDNALNIKLAKAILKTGNHHVLVAEDAESGLQLARKNRPHLILMDIQLPGIDGLAATEIIKKDPDLKHIPVIALTSYAMKDDREKSFAAGCDEHISKPVDYAELLDKISIILR